ncbi:Os06g0661733 [Oryza sativa Japonica Group]|uniref:Os06g0661733 protein n=1 Tax=Oryza sativa subsp. japonica TaxID=39947 RepID=A0A0P0WZW7_ORYSJ|nr:hypothetical protein EE612_035845 [Oryza sativa]BAS98987.1 Os06g0661733 [Oryza sativa Japonica Group]
MHQTLKHTISVMLHELFRQNNTQLPFCSISIINQEKVPRIRIKIIQTSYFSCTTLNCVCPVTPVQFYPIWKCLAIKIITKKLIMKLPDLFEVMHISMEDIEKRS